MSESFGDCEERGLDAGTEFLIVFEVGVVPENATNLGELSR